MEVSQVDGVIEAVFGAERGLDGGGDVWVAGELGEGVAGGEGENGEQDDADAQQAGDCEQDPAEEVRAGQ